MARRWATSSRSSRTRSARRRGHAACPAGAVVCRYSCSPTRSGAPVYWAKRNAAGLLDPRRFLGERTRQRLHGHGLMPEEAHCGGHADGENPPMPGSARRWYSVLVVQPAESRVRTIYGAEGRLCGSATPQGRVEDVLAVARRRCCDVTPAARRWSHARGWLRRQDRRTGGFRTLTCVPSELRRCANRA